MSPPLVERWRWAAYPVVLFALSRAALMFISGFGMAMDPRLYYPGGPREWLQHHPVLDGFCRWDCGMYEKLAREGHWDAGSTNFLPAFPALARGLAEVTGLHLHLWLILLPNFALLAALLVLYRLFTKLEGEDAARWGLAVFVAYPFAFFQAAAFPEAFMTLLTAVAMSLALRGKHLGAAATLALSFFFKQLSLLAGPGLVAAQLRERWPQGWKRALFHPSVLALALPPLALGAYIYYVDAKFGEPLAFWTVREKFGPLASWRLTDLFTHTDWNPYTLPIAAFVGFSFLIIVPGVVGLWLRRHYELAAFATFHIGVLLVIGLWGLGRYSSSGWPAFLAVGVLLAKRPALGPPLVCMLAVVQGMFFFFFTHQYPVM